MSLICKIFGHQFCLTKTAPVMESIGGTEIFTYTFSHEQTMSNRCLRCGFVLQPVTREQIHQEVVDFCNRNDRVSMADVLRIIKGDPKEGQ